MRLLIVLAAIGGLGLVPISGDFCLQSVGSGPTQCGPAFP